MRRARDWLLIPFLVVVAAICIAWGGRATYRAVRNWSPLTITCADYLAHPPASDWVRLTGCTPASDSIGIETFERANEPRRFRDASVVYVPLSPAGAQTRDGGGIPLLLRVDHGPILRLGSTFVTEQDTALAADALSQPIEGLVERSLDRSARDRDKLRDLGFHLAEEFVVIDYGARPRPLWLGLGILGIGLGALALLVRKWRRRTRPVALAKAKLVAG